MELREDADISGTFVFSFKFRILHCPRFWDAAPPRHAVRVREPNFSCLGEVNSPGAEVLPGGQNARTAQSAAPSKMGPLTWSCEKQQHAGGPTLFS